MAVRNRLPEPDTSVVELENRQAGFSAVEPDGTERPNMEVGETYKATKANADLYLNSGLASPVGAGAEKDKILAEQALESVQTGEQGPFGRRLAEASVTHGHYQPEGNPEAVAGSANRYEDKTHRELKELSRERGIEGAPRMNKSELVQANYAYDENESSGEEEQK